MSHRVCVVAHPERRTIATQLADQIGADTVWDQNSNGATYNHCQAWKHLTQYDTEWSIVLEDDAVPTAHWCELSTYLDSAPTTVVSLYLGYGVCGPSQQAAVKTTVTAYPEAQWYLAKRTMGAVGLAIPTSRVDELLRFTRTRYTAWDDAVGEWAQQRLKERVAFTNPSLVDHLDVPSLIHDRTSVRKAYRVTGAVQEGLVVDNLW